MVVKIVPNDKGNPPSKLADAELHFTEGVLEGLKLVGFAVWERSSGSGRNVTFPSRQYTVSGDRRSFLLPTAQASPTGHLRSAPQPLRQHLPRNPAAQHEEDARETCAIRNARPSTVRPRR